MPSVLIVCSANMCRSPMGEGILKHLVETKPDANQWHIESAGVWARKGNPPTPTAVLVMKFMGIDIDSHLSQPVSKELLTRFDVILTMERIHKEVLKKQYPDIAERVYLLSEMVGDYKEIDDPIGGVAEDYQKTALELKRYLSEGLERIIEIADQIDGKKTG